VKTLKKWFPVVLIAVAVVAVLFGSDVMGLENMAYDPKPGG
jgi:hypothetical protein